jgi:polysaccharide deacetylase family protein (PEP-CTERM system associated)
LAWLTRARIALSGADGGPDVGTTVAPVALMVRHFFTVDVEEYFHASVFERVAPQASWRSMESRVDVGVNRLLELLAQHNATATFFVLGWLACRRPDMVRAIASAGHEIASHGWAHQRVTGMDARAFRNDIRRARNSLQDICGASVDGYRAPSFSITRGNDWALDVLIEEGHTYDSSLVPVARPGYGYRGGSDGVHWLRRVAGSLLEVPPATLSLCGVRLPAGGGAYFRLLPLGLAQRAFRSYEARGVPGTFYLHPWELDPGQPRLAVPWWTRMRHYGGIPATEQRLREFMREFRFTSISNGQVLS